MGRLIEPPFIAHSELTNEIYIVDKNNKYCVTDQIMKAVVATNRAIPKADYENRLKADMVAILKDLDLQIDELSFSDEEPINITQDYIDELRSWEYGKNGCKKLIQQKINSLKGE